MGTKQELLRSVIGQEITYSFDGSYYRVQLNPPTNSISNRSVLEEVTETMIRLSPTAATAKFLTFDIVERWICLDCVSEIERAR